jgi:glycosyltransferase involved in cell wall biosynthesis
MASLAPHISSYCIADTGSTDDTIPLIINFFKALNIPGEVHRCEFVDFSQARNVALRAMQASDLPFDYGILVDADMELKVIDPNWKNLITDQRSYDMFQLAGPLHYQNRRLIKRGEPKGYLGVTHEYLDVDTGGCIPKEVAHFIDHADGANRPDKFTRDIQLLEKGLKDEPGNARYLYYLAQSYKEAGQPKKAIKYYERRIAAGGWDEEVWSAQHMLAQCYKDMGKDAKFVWHSLKAYNMRPQRAEPLYDVAKWFREKPDQQHASLVFSEKALQIPPTTDALFVNDYTYAVGCWDEFAVAAFYSNSPATKMMGFKANNMLSLKPGPYSGSRELARTNMFYYMPSLKEIAPSFEWKTIGYSPGVNWTALNPSVTVHGKKLMAVVRTVNYRMDEYGRYLIQGTDGTINNENPISTRNWLITLDSDLNDSAAEEIKTPELPCGYPLVVGFEDMRLFSHTGSLWTSSTVRQIDPDGLAEQVLFRLGDDKYRRMLRTPRLYEKNWAAIVERGKSLRFMYHPGHVVDDHGQDVIVNASQWDVGGLNGSSQLVRVGDRWLAITHEARFIPGTQLRYYMHRFIEYSRDFVVTKISVPFYFRGKCIEFCAGMCLHPNKKDPTLVVSFGFKDAEACIGTVLLSDVERFLGSS